jgi:Fe2+ or Zn2+ uptake regulation protein
MSIDKQHGHIIFMCDECNDDFETDSHDFMTALGRVKEEDWVVKRNDDDTEWLHICPDCAMGHTR